MIKGFEKAIEDFNKWNGPAWLYINVKEGYIDTEVFHNDVGKSQTVLKDGCYCIFSKSERENYQIGEKRRKYIEEFSSLVQKGWEPYQIEYHLAGKYFLF